MDETRISRDGTSRRSFLKGVVGVTLVHQLGIGDAAGEKAMDRPNVLYIALEDITPMMGCYGDTYAKTPVFDSLAAEGVRYTRAYAVAPVCSPSRSSVVCGMYPSSLGTVHHRSNVGAPPDFLKMIPNHMREAGYYTTNNAKQDYNIGGARWHESSHEAHWRNRPDKKQPFFAKFDLQECHSSITKISEDVIVEQRLNRLRPEDFHDPAKTPIPPYHPDVPEFRLAWARYYDSVTQVDYRAGEIIDQLKEDGLWDDTIVFVWADHGVGMPRGKHNAWEEGLHVPLIVRFPEKYQHLAPAAPGSVVDDLVTLMDMGPSVLALAGIDTPEYMHGRPLFCRGDAKKREYVVGMRDRLDSRFEMVRSVRDERYRYQRNFYPHLPYKPYEDYEFDAPLLCKWVELARAGKLTGAQELLARRLKPVEELYDSETDPHMIRNLADDPEYASVLKRMRGQLRDWMVETRDLGIFDEAEQIQRTVGSASGAPSTLGQIDGRIAAVSSSHPGMGEQNMLDGSAETFWHTQFAPTVAEPPHYVVLEIPDGTPVAGLAYTARSGPNARILAYEVYASDDGKVWGDPITEGRFDPEDVAKQEIPFPEPLAKQFIKFQSLDAVSGDGKSVASIGELDVLTEGEAHPPAEPTVAKDGYASPWHLGQSLENYEQLLDAANLPLSGQAAIPEMLARLTDADSAIRFWACLGLVASRSDSDEVVAAFEAALGDASVSVRITAAEGLFNPGRYEEGLPILIEALGHSIPAAQIRSACVLDSQPPEARQHLQPAVEALKQAAEKTDVCALPWGFPMGSTIRLSAP